MEETYFQQIPQELSLEVFRELGYPDAKNFIKGSGLLELFSRGSTWIHIFSHSFGDLKLSRVTSIDYNRRDFLYYLTLYRELAVSYAKSLNVINVDTDLREATINKYYKTRSRPAGSTVLPEDLIEDIKEALSPYYYSINLAIYYEFANEEIRKKLDDGNIMEISDVIFKMRANGEYFLDTLHLLGYPIYLDHKSSIEFLMYVFFNNVT